MKYGGKGASKCAIGIVWERLNYPCGGFCEKNRADSAEGGGPVIRPQHNGIFRKLLRLII